VGAHLPDPRELDVTPVGAEPEGSGGERQLSRPRLPLNRGKPTRRPARAPEREDDQFDSAVVRLASPEAYASLLFCAHHGARASLAWFHARRRLYADQSTVSVSWSSGMS
jgi:hypothetical protein